MASELRELALLLDAAAGQAAWLARSALLAARVLPVALLAPWLVVGAGALGGLQLVSALAAAGACAVGLLPLALAGPAPELALGWALAPHLLAELLRGCFFALAVALPLSAFGWAGALADRLRAAAGAPVDELEDPAALARLYRAAAVALFCASGGHRVVLSAFAEGLRAHPLGSLPASAGLAAGLRAAVSLVQDALTLAVTLCAPVLVCVLVVALSLSLLGRVARPLAASSAAGPLSLAVLGAVCLTLARTLDALPTALSVFVAQAARLLRTLG
jgi:type III secretory pathway component EscT